MVPISKQSSPNERKHTHQQAMGKDAPKLKTEPPKSHQKQVSIEDVHKPSTRSHHGK